MKRRRVKNLLALAVLSYLTQRPMHPYELQRMLLDNDAGQTFRLSYGSLYNVVQQLADAGLPPNRASSGRPAARADRVCADRGRTGRDARLAAATARRAPPDHPSFVAALSLLAALHPDEAVACLRQRVREQEAQRQRIADLVRRTLEQGVHPLFLVEDDYRPR